MYQVSGHMCMYTQETALDSYNCVSFPLRWREFFILQLFDRIHLLTVCVCVCVRVCTCVHVELNTERG